MELAQSRSAPERSRLRSITMVLLLATGFVSGFGARPQATGKAATPLAGISLPGALLGASHYSPDFGDWLPAALGAAPPGSLSRETVIAEKFQIMLHRGMLNSRLRDYYDIWLLSRSFPFDGVLLAEAIKKTCWHRDTPIVERPAALSAEFPIEGVRETQWRAFRRKGKLEDAIVHLLRRGLSQRTVKPTALGNRVKLPIIECAHEARPDEEMTPERVARLLHG